MKSRIEDKVYEDQVLLVPRPCLFERLRIWGRSFFGTEALFAFFIAFPCLYLGIETLFAFFVWPGHFSVGRKSGQSALPTDRVCMRTILICPGRTILSKRQGRGTSGALSVVAGVRLLLVLHSSDALYQSLTTHPSRGFRVQDLGFRVWVKELGFRA